MRRPGANFLLTASSPCPSLFSSHTPTTFFSWEKVESGFYVLFETKQRRWRLVGSSRVRGRPLLASDFVARRITAHVAQSVEHLHGKQKVSGSIPLVGSIVRTANGRVTCFRRHLAPRVSLIGREVLRRVSLNGQAEV